VATAYPLLNAAKAFETIDDFDGIYFSISAEKS